MKTSYLKMRAILSAALALALLTGIPGAALADGDGSTLPPPAVEEGEPLPESGGLPTGEQVQEQTQEQVQEPLQPEGETNEYFEPGTFEQDVITPETEPTIPVEPETAVPPLPEEPAVAAMEPVVAVPAETYDDSQCPQWDDPLYYKLQGQISTVSLAGSFEGFKPRALAANEVLHKGVDVSEYQSTINWTSAKKAGVEFAIIRCALRGSTTGKLYKDGHFAENLANAHAAGIKVGAYIFSQATTVKEAREEADYLVSVVKGYNIDLPLVFDFEETSNSDRRLKMKDLSSKTMMDICNAFCEEVEKAGYQSMLYSNPSTINNHLIRSQIKRLWLAHYATKSDYTGSYEYWQCGYGTIEGIPGTVDLDFWFEPNGVSVPPLNENVVKPSASPSPTPKPTSSPEPGSTPAPSPTPSPEPETPVSTPPTVVAPENIVNPFTDVTTSKWYYNSVLWAYGKGVINGLSATSFGPNATATRGQLVAMLYRLQGQPAVTGSSGFTDLAEDYYRDAVTWASHNGIVSGFTETLFGPNNKVTREQLATMLYRMAGSPSVSGDLSRFTDARAVHSYSVSALIWAVGKGVVTGYDDDTIKPAEPATRAEVCTMLGRFASLG